MIECADSARDRRGPLEQTEGHPEEISAAWAADRQPEPALAAHHISVSFRATQALRDASLTVRHGTVHALLGENGSGKSSLIKVLAGVYQADAGGTIRAGSSVCSTANMAPGMAYELGLRFVHQDLGLFDDLTIAENMALYSGYPTRTLGAIKWRSLKAATARLLDRFEIEATPHTLVGRLRPALRTMVAVARAVQDDAHEAGRVLILDEPTASLPTYEADLLLQLLRRRADLGDAVVLISHRLQEVLTTASDLTVFRDGRTIAAGLNASTTTEQEIGRLIAGRTIGHVGQAGGPQADAPLVADITSLKAAQVSVDNLHIRAGEVIGLAGLGGAGKSTLLRAIFGDVSNASGTVAVGDSTGPFRSPARAMAAGVAYVPEDRIREGVFLDLSVGANLSISVIGQHFRRLWLHRDDEVAANSRLIDQFGVKCGSLHHSLATLSGGNQQKLVLARWLQRRPSLLLLNEPTQSVGVDIGARSDIYKLIRSATQDGCGVLLASSDPEELSDLCDRVCLMYDGRIIDEILPPHTSPPELFQRIHASAKEVAT